PNQVTLGTFLGTFLFCLVALRSIRDDSAYHLPALTAFVLTVISLSLFLYFVHHLVRSLQAENIVESVATLLLDEIENFFPEAPSSDSGEDEAERERKAWDELEGEISVLSEKAGYLQFIDTRQLLELASVHDCRIRVIIRPGQLVLESGCLFACETSGEMSEKGKKQFLDCFIVGRQRTPEQDIEFEIRQLVEVGVRALSPGINDPFTAMNCIDLLTVTLGRIAQRNLPENVFYGDDNVPRLQLRPTSFRNLLDTAFLQLRHDGVTRPDVSIRLFEALFLIAQKKRNEEQLSAVCDFARMLEQEARDRSRSDFDRECIRQNFERIMELRE
ncbi:MAG: DUF2254 domain-containing protein, partial [Verrucomicrobiales bacterium]|nr:DUF2254 domain-containing protein [Verrucomicrobiales bacterium]